MSCTDIAERLDGVGPILGGVDRAVTQKLGNQLIANLDEGTGTGWCGEALKAFADQLDAISIVRAVDHEIRFLEQGCDDLTFIEVHMALVALCPKVPQPQSDHIANRLLAVMRKEKNLWRLSHLVSALTALSSRMDSRASNEMVRRLVDLMDEYPDIERKNAAADAIASFATNLDRDQASARIEELLPRLLVQRQPNCKPIASLVRPDTVAKGISVIEWPTCPPNDRALLVRRILELVGKRSKGAKDSVELTEVDDWKLYLQWRRTDEFKSYKIGYDLLHPSVKVIN